MSFSVAAFTLGCKVNQYDTESILRDFAALGFTITDFNSISDVYIINTCTVTNVSDKKSRQMINRAYKRNPNALIVAYGCYVQVEPESIEKLPGVSMALGTADKYRVAELVSSKLMGSRGLVPLRGVGGAEPQGLKRTRAYLKIQDGCDRYCSYCIVPYARGGIKSRPVAEAVAEAEMLVKEGCKEIVLTGIQIASYGNDLNNKENLISLMKYIHDIPGLERLRLGSLDPNVVNKDFLRVAGSLPKLCDHFHLSLQSGCDRILEGMNRRYTTAQFAKVVEGIRSCFPEVAITTDVIVGFPGETEKDFAESLSFVEKIGFFRVHVFIYSPRDGTPAASFPGQVDQKTKESRSRMLRKLAESMNHDFYKRYVGQIIPVLFESETKEESDKTNLISKRLWEGHTTQYLTVRAISNESLSNQIINVRLMEIRDGVVYGALC